MGMLRQGIDFSGIVIDGAYIDGVIPISDEPKKAKDKNNVYRKVDSREIDFERGVNMYTTELEFIPEQDRSIKIVGAKYNDNGDIVYEAESPLFDGCTQEFVQYELQDFSRYLNCEEIYLIDEQEIREKYLDNEDIDIMKYIYEKDAIPTVKSSDAVADEYVWSKGVKYYIKDELLHILQDSHNGGRLEVVPAFKGSSIGEHNNLLRYILKNVKGIVIEEGLYAILDDVFNTNILGLGDDCTVDHVVFKEHMSIRPRAFKGMYWLKSVCGEADIIGREAFKNCYHLTTSGICDHTCEIGSSAYENCYSLQEVSIDASCTENSTLTIDDGAFRNCSSLVSFDTMGIKLNVGEEAFYNCNSLKRIGIGQDKVVINKNAFAGCTNLLNITLAKKTLGMIDTGAFRDCIEVISEGEMQPNGYSKLSVKLSESIDNFSYDDLSIIKLGSKTWGIVKEENGKTRLYIKGSGATYDFGAGNMLGDIADHKYTTSQYGYLRDNSIIRAAIRRNPNGIIDEVIVTQGITTLGESLFDGLEVGKILVADTVTKIHRYAFANCEHLTECELPLRRVSYDGFVFENCTNLREIKGLSTECIPTGMFRMCKRLKDVQCYPVCGLKTIEAGAFYGCESLASVEGMMLDTLTSIGEEAFLGCKSLKYVKLPERIDKIGNYAFINGNSVLHIEVMYKLSSKVREAVKDNNYEIMYNNHSREYRVNPTKAYAITVTTY